MSIQINNKVLFLLFISGRHGCHDKPNLRVWGFPWRYFEIQTKDELSFGHRRSVNSWFEFWQSPYEQSILPISFCFIFWKFVLVLNTSIIKSWNSANVCITDFRLSQIIYVNVFFLLSYYLTLLCSNKLLLIKLYIVGLHIWCDLCHLNALVDEFHYMFVWTQFQ